MHCYSSYIYDKKERDYIIRGVHSCIQKFFGPSILYRVISENVLPTSLENIRSSFLKLPENTKPEELEACFENSPNQINIKLEGHLNGNLCSDSVIYEARNLDVDCFRIRESEILLHFKGEHLRCTNTFLYNPEIVEFLNAWNSDQRSENLKFLAIHSYFDLDKDQILRKVYHKSLNPPEFIKWNIRYFFSYLTYNSSEFQPW